MGKCKCNNDKKNCVKKDKKKKKCCKKIIIWDPCSDPCLPYPCPPQPCPPSPTTGTVAFQSGLSASTSFPSVAPGASANVLLPFNLIGTVPQSVFGPGVTANGNGTFTLSATGLYFIGAELAVTVTAGLGASISPNQPIEIVAQLVTNANSNGGTVLLEETQTLFPHISSLILNGSLIQTYSFAQQIANFDLQVLHNVSFPQTVGVRLIVRNNQSNAGFNFNVSANNNAFYAFRVGRSSVKSLL